MQVPDDLLYTVEHEWLRKLDGSRFRIGITDYAQDQLGDVVYVGLPEVGRTVSQGDLMAEIESTKSVGEVYSPVSGVIASVNQATADRPELVNNSPYDEGWLVEIDAETGEGDFLTPVAYREMTE
jgi:glycine cleavage system H protein